MRARSKPKPLRKRTLGGALLSLVVPAAAAAAALPAGGGRFTLSSPDLSAGAEVPPAYVYHRNGCRGRNLSPALSWQHPPAAARSFAVLIYDSDAPGGWWHWLVLDIPAEVRALPVGAGEPGGRGLPAGAVQTRNDYGSVGYGGPCPPPGPAHHYHILLYALRTPRVAVPQGAPPGAVAAAVRAAAIAETEITVVYGR